MLRNPTFYSNLISKSVIMKKKNTFQTGYHLWKFTAQRVKHGRGFARRYSAMSTELLPTDLEKWGAVQVVTVPPAEIPRWQDLCVSPFLLFVWYFISFRKEANGRPWNKTPAERHPSIFSLPPSMRINGGYKALIADIFKKSQQGCLGRIILMLKKRIGNSSTPWIFMQLLNDLSPAYAGKSLWPSFFQVIGHKIVPRHQSPYSEILNDS